MFLEMLALKAGKKGAEKTKEFYKAHPEAIVYSAGAVALVGACVWGVVDGIRYSSIAELNVDTQVTSADDGRGTVVDLDLELPEIEPITGFTADVEGAQSVLSKQLSATVLNGLWTTPSISAGNNWVTLDTRVPTVINIKSESIDLQYDEGAKDDDDDDRIIVNVPLDAFEITHHIDEDFKEVAEYNGDWQKGAENIAEAITDTFSAAESIPGVGDLSDAKTEGERVVLAVTRVNAMNNVAEVCAPMVAQNPVVNEALHNNIAEVAKDAVNNDTDDPTIKKLNDTKSGTFIKNLDVDVFIGAENDNQPVLPDQKLNFTNPFTAKMEEFKKNPDIEFKSAGNFECELSDELKKELGEDAPASTASPAPSAEAKDD